MRGENAAFILPANSSVIREEEERGEGERRKREAWRGGRIVVGRGGVAEAVRSVRLKQTELVPWDKKKKKVKMTDQEIWQAPLIFIFPSLEWYQPPAASSQRAAIWEATWDACQLTRYTFNPYFFFPPRFLFCPYLISNHFCNTHFSFPGTSTLLIWRSALCQNTDTW